MRSNLKKLRKKHNLSVSDIARKLEISTSFYYKIESGDRNPTMLLAKQICNIIHTNVDEIFFDSSLDGESNTTDIEEQESA